MRARGGRRNAKEGRFSEDGEKFKMQQAVDSEELGHVGSVCRGSGPWAVTSKDLGHGQ